jgi:hypothetical protein
MDRNGNGTITIPSPPSNQALHRKTLTQRTNAIPRAATTTPTTSESTKQSKLQRYHHEYLLELSSQENEDTQDE